jgi:hypothetical protein
MVSPAQQSKHRYDAYKSEIGYSLPYDRLARHKPLNKTNSMSGTIKPSPEPPLLSVTVTLLFFDEPFIVLAASLMALAAEPTELAALPMFSQLTELNQPAAI